MNYISELLQSLLTQHRSADIIESEFKKLLYEDEDVKNKYKEWCETLGYSEKTGYMEYIEEILETQESIWDTINEYDDYR